MSKPSDDISTSTRRLDELIAAYLQAEEAGQDCDEAKFMAIHPDFAAGLAEFFDSRRQFQAITGPFRIDESQLDVSGMASRDQPSGRPTPATPLRWFGNYELLDVIASGGMGIVYRARQLKLDRIVALKTILAGRSASPTDVERFYAEARAAAQLHHPNIVAIHEFGEQDGQHYFSMDYIEGRDLASILQERPLEPRRAARYVQIVAEAADYAHQMGILHRDLKPSNILIDGADQPRIADFGLAKQLDADPDLTGTGQILGTASYMAPEQCQGKQRGRSPSPTVDVYALGAILYACLVGRPPFQAADTLETLMQVVGQEPVPLRQHNVRLPRDLETICLKCLEKEPGKRYATAAELADDLRRFQANEPIQARPVGLAGRVVKWIRRRPAAAALTLVSFAAILLLLGTLAVGNVLITRKQQETQQALARESQALSDRTQALKDRTQALNDRTQALEAERRTSYYTSVALAQREWDVGRILRARDLLDGCLPAPGQADLRGWEWHLLQRLCHQCSGTLEGQAGWINGLAYSPDGKHLATISSANPYQPRELRVWNIDTRKVDFSYGPAEGDRVQYGSLAYSPDGRKIAIGTFELFGTAPARILLLDVVEKKVTSSIEADNNDDMLSKLSYSPDGGCLGAVYLGYSDGKACPPALRVWDARSGAKQFQAQVDQDQAWFGGRAPAFSPDGSRVALVQCSRIAPEKLAYHLRIWQVPGGQEIGGFPVGSGGHLGGLAWSHDGRRIATSSFDTVHIWDADTGNELLTLHSGGGRAEQLSFQRNDQRLLVCGSDGKLCVLDAVNGWWRAVARAHDGNVAEAAFSPDGGQIASTEGTARVFLWDAARLGPDQDDEGRRFHTGLRCESLRFTPDGRLLASSTSEWDVIFWDVATGKEIKRLTTVHAPSANRRSVLAFTPDGRQLATGSGDWRVRTWDWPSGKKLLELQTDSEETFAVSFSPDGTRLIAVGAGGRWHF